MKDMEKSYNMTTKEQLQLWVTGISIHQFDFEYPDDRKRGQCCPDFSCCQPKKQAHKEERELYQELYLAGKHREYERMLMMFLGRAFGEYSIYSTG